MLAVLAFLARDAKWEVRQRVAELLDRLPEESFGGLAAQLSEDENSYVRKAAERSLDLGTYGLGSNGGASMFIASSHIEARTRSDVRQRVLVRKVPT